MDLGHCAVVSITARLFLTLGGVTRKRLCRVFFLRASALLTLQPSVMMLVSVPGSLRISRFVLRLSGQAKTDKVSQMLLTS